MKNKYLLYLGFFFMLCNCGPSQKKPSQIRIGQFMFTNEPIEVLFSSKHKASIRKKLTYTELTNYQTLEPGMYDVAVKSNKKTLLKKKIGIGTEGVYTLILYGIPQKNQKTNQKTTKTKLLELAEGEEANTPNGNLPQLKILNDKFECGKSEAKIRWVHLAAGVEEVSATIYNTKETKTTPLSSLPYPHISEKKALSIEFDKKMKWYLKGSKVEAAQTNLKLKPQYLYTCFILGKKGNYLERLKVVTGKTPKEKF